MLVIRTSQSQTQVEVGDGKTTVIGGMFIESETENKTPGCWVWEAFLSFGTSSKSSRTLWDPREIIFLITA